MSKFFTNSIIVGLLCLVSTSSIVIGQETSNNLRSTEPLMKGHFVALYMDHLFVSYAPVVDYDATIIVRFDETEALFELQILGRQTNIDRAKKSTDLFRQNLLSITLKNLNDHFHLALSEDDVIISYVNNKSLKTLLVFSDGNYIIE